MADPPDGLLGRLFPGNDPAALYGGALTDPATRAQMAQRGLLAMAGSFADSAMPTRMPTPIGAVLGHAAAALGASDDAVMANRLRNAQSQQAMANTGLLNQMGPAYEMFFKEFQRQQAAGAPGGGIASPPAPGSTTVPGAGGTGPVPTGPIDPSLVTNMAAYYGMNPLVAHTSMDIESSYGKNTGNDKSPSNTGAFQLAKADAPGGMNDTHENQVRIGVEKLLGEQTRLRSLLGREPTNAEIYLAHQQGPDGAYKLLSNLDAPAGKLVPAINISNNAGEPTASAGAFVKHWEQEYTKREAKFAGLNAPGPGTGAAPPPVQTAQAPAAPPAPPGGLLNMPDFTGKMNAPISGIAGPSPVAPAAPGPAAGGPQSAGAILNAANQATSAAGGPPRLPPGLVQTADASGAVPLPSGLARGGASLLGAAGAPQSLVTAPPPDAPVPPAARPLPPAPPPVAAGPPPAPPMGGTGGPPPLNLPPPPTTMPPMPGGGMPPMPQATPLQMIAQGIVGLSSLTGHPAPDFMQKIAGQPLEMQMEAYKAYVGEQAKQMTAQYQKDLDAHAARFIAFETSQGNLPADLTKLNTEQALKLRNDMLTQHGLVLGSDGHWNIDPTWLNAQAQKAYATARGPAEFKTVTVDVPDDPNNPNGPMHKQTMSEAQFRDWQSGGGGPGAGTGTAAIISGKGDTGTGGTAGAAPGARGSPVYNPMQTEGMGAVAKQNAIAFEKVHTDAAAANEAQAQATNMREGAKTFYTGPWSAYNQALNKVLATLSGDPERASKVAGYEAFIKDTGFLARQQASAMGSKVGIQELSMVKDSLASEETSPRGLDRVMAQVQGLADYKLVKQQAMNDWVTRPDAAPGGWDNNGFEAHFNKNLSPYTFMYMRLSDIDKAELKANLFKTKEGRADLQRLNNQIDYVTNNNLMPR